MLSNLFFQALLVICCTLFVSAHYASGSTGQPAVQKGVELFKTPAEISKIFDTKGTADSGGAGNSITPTDFYSPFLVATDDVIVALAGVNSTSSDSANKINVLTRHVEIKGGNEWLSKATPGDIDADWKKQFAVNDFQQYNEKSVKFVFAAAQNNKIYLLLVNDTGQATISDVPDTPKPCDYCFFTGTFEESLKGKIKWEDKAPLTENIKKLKQQLDQQNLNKIPSNGYVLFDEKQNSLFALQFDDKSNNSKKAFAFIELEKQTETSVNLATLEAEGDCLFKLFSWKTKIMLAKYCGGKSSILEKDGEKGWENTKEPISRLLHHFKDKNNFTAASITYTNVLLFTQQKTVGSAQKSNSLYLWMTDGSRLHNVGSIASSETDEITSAGLLYTKKKQLFLLHEQTETGDQNPKGIIFTHIKEQLEKINTKLEKWKNSNIKVQQLYKDTVTKENTFSTDGLVGFLSGISRDQWTNMYHDFHATLHNNNKKESENSFEFNGKGAGAKWQVGQKNEDQPYKFTDPGFTLVTTVKIGNNTNGKGNSILGVTVTSDTNYVGLLCTNDGNWDIKCKTCQNKVQPQNVACKYDKPYYVALILNNTVISVYVNGKKLPEFYEQQIQISALQSIQDFYFGADSNAEELAATDVTITNVLLYNRPFTEEEVKQLKPKQEDEADNQAIPQSNGGTIPRNKRGTEQIDNSSPETSAEQTVTKNETKDEQSSSPPPTTEDSAARVGGVGVLCFMLFGVFTLLGCYVY